MLHVLGCDVLVVWGKACTSVMPPGVVSPDNIASTQSTVSGTREHRGVYAQCSHAATAAAAVFGGMLCVLQDPNLVGGLLSCFGKLFTATLAPGWQQQADTSESDQQPAGNSNGSGSSTENGGSSSSEKPCAMLTVRNNDVTRVRAELDSASFVSAVPPRVVVRLLHIVVLAVVHKFLNASGKRLAYVNKVGRAAVTSRACLLHVRCSGLGSGARLAYGHKVGREHCA